MTRRLIVVAVSAVLVVGLACTGEAKGIPQETGVHRAYVLGDGTFQSHSKDVLAVAKSGTGSYLITMKKALANCALTASIPEDGNANGGSITTTFYTGVSPQTISVITYDGAGSPENRDFFLIVACTR